MLKRSSRVIPGFLGTPAGIITMLAPSKQDCSSVSPECPETLTEVEICPKSADIPMLAISYSARWETVAGSSFINNDNGCPIPPAAPRIATFLFVPPYNILSTTCSMSMNTVEKRRVIWASLVNAETIYVRIVDPQNFFLRNLNSKNLSLAKN